MQFSILVLLMILADIPLSLAGEVLCELQSMAQLMEITNSSSCAVFKQQYLVPFDPNNSYWHTPPMEELQRRLYYKINRKEALRIGVLGGSVSLSWVNGSAPLASTLQRLFDYPSIEVYNGAMGGTGAIVPAGCLSTILGDIVLDIVILEFAINDFSEKNLRALVDHLQHRFNDDITIILLSVTSRLMKMKHPTNLAKGLLMNRSVAKRYGLILIDWSSVADKGYGITYRPDEIWHDKNKQHPMRIGQDWIQYCVATFIHDIYSRRDPSITATAHRPSTIELQLDTLCLSSFMCDVFGAHVHRFEKYSHMGRCWKMVVKDYMKTCIKLAYADDFNPECIDESDHTISFTVQTAQPCQLYFTVVGNHVGGRQNSVCTLEVHVNERFVVNATGYNQYVTQTPYLLLPEPLAVGAYNVSVIGRGTSESPPPICSIGSIICV